MFLADALFDFAEIDEDGHARLKAEQAAAERFAKVTANCPCDQYPFAQWCRNECKLFLGWVRTGKVEYTFV